MHTHKSYHLGFNPDRTRVVATVTQYVKLPENGFDETVQVETTAPP